MADTEPEPAEREPTGPEPLVGKPTGPEPAAGEPRESEPTRPEPTESNAPESDATEAPDGDAAEPLTALSLPGQLIIAVAIAVAAVAAAIHLSAAFLNVSPPNTLTKRHGAAIDDYVYPEFERVWKLFAPNPLQQNIAVQARAEIRTSDGGTATTGWRDLSAQDGAAIHHNPLPSHTQQNELRRGWEFYVGSHDTRERPQGMRGNLSEQYIRRIVMLRLGREEDGGTVERIQVRSATTPVAPPPWSDEKIDTKTVYRTLPWWTVTSDDLPEAKRR
ncbi:DUF5819 family protein [Streptomyces rugosispiralis]|uniref:DUF5819 family protein n=1 Tax=Streptomyces rugosispiralis TaxID=2967341 RepID=A0ABT1VCA1_9ACTN|nr:DUF5819 family protein [Streptomyces rugosispiralis]MCQ8195027.1 DUF5819 family protein [Streptomyces rugosispiralis]